MRLVRRLAAVLLLGAPLGYAVSALQAGADTTENTTTTLAAITSPVAYNSETQTFTIDVTGDTANASYGSPLGTAYIYAGAGETDEVCHSSAETFINTNESQFTCESGETTLDAGTYSVYAYFAPGSPSSTSSTSNGVDYNSSSSGTRTLEVNAISAGTPSVTVSTSPGTIDYGSETVETVSVTVQGTAGEGAPQGTVTLNGTGAGICSSNPTYNAGDSDPDLGTAVFTCTATNADALTASTTAYSIGAHYTAPAYTDGTASTSSTNSDYYYLSQTTSTPASLQVDSLESTTTTITSYTTPVTYGAEAQTFTVDVLGQPADGDPLGTVTVSAGATQLCTVSTQVDDGSGHGSTFSCQQTNNDALAGNATPYSLTATYTPGSPGSSSTVTGYDYSGSSSTASYPLKVNGAGILTITSSSPLPTGTPNVFYTTTLHATGGTVPYTWSKTSGSLPTGLQLNSATGVISGTPTATGVYNFDIEVTDSSTPEQTAGPEEFTISIFNTLQITTRALPGASRGRNYSTTLTATGGNGAYTWSIVSGSLPPGLSLNAGTGVISGQAPGHGSWTFTVQVADHSDPVQTATRTFTIYVS